jgi:transketolase
MSDTRLEFFEYLKEEARADKDVILLVGDLGYSFMEDFAEEFPDQFINCGIAEQNMVGVAAGLARAGKKPYVYSGAMFLATRALEQIRDDICYPNLNVKLIGTGASGFLGFTHNFEGNENVDDLLKNLPNLEVTEYLYRLNSSHPIFLKL